MIGREPRFRSVKSVFSVLSMSLLLILLAAALYHVVLAPALTDIALAVGEVPSKATKEQTTSPSTGNKLAPAMSPEADVDQLNMLKSIKATGEAAESRSYETKRMARELIGYVRIMVAVLIVIAVGFPLAIWLISRRRLLGLSGLSSEVTATLVLVEERQAKLANILKDIQNEIDYVHTMSVPDLKNLIQQAEAYLKQNEKDLKEAGSRRDAS